VRQQAVVGAEPMGLKFEDVAEVVVHALEPGDKLELSAFTVHAAKAPKGAEYVRGMPKLGLFSEHFLAPEV